MFKFAYRDLRFANLNRFFMKSHKGMRPQDIAILAKIACQENNDWLIKDLAAELFISQSEVSESLNRSVYAGLLSNSKKRLIKASFYEFLLYGLKYVFPQKPGTPQRGMLTSYAALPLSKIILSEEKLVWPFALGKDRGLSIEPLYPNLPKACELDDEFYEMMSLIDVLRTGSNREFKLASEELEQRILVNEKHSY